MRSLSASAGSILTLVLSASIHGQSCVPDWLPTFESGDLHGPVRAFALFDFDAGGPNPTTLVALQAYASTTSDLDVDPANRRPVQRWTGRRWEPVGGPELESVGAATVRGALAVYDPDAEGPLPPALYAASRSLRVTRDGRTSYGIARFDGAAWTHVSMGFTSGHVSILDLQVFDEDGPGPLAPALFAACDHLPAADGVHNLLRLRDDAWSTVGSTPLNAAVANLMVWDPDGAGSMPERLIAAGLFDHSADSPPGPSYLALWNGAQWEPIGAGQPGQPGPALGLALFDPDGNGPATQELYVAAADNPIDGTPRGLLSWNGQQWTHHGVVPEFVEFEGGQVNRGRMAVHDDDGPGPIRPALYVAGVPSATSTSARVSRWSGSDWSVPGHDPLAPNQSGHRYPVVFSSGTKIEAFASFDLDGQGPSTATLLMGGDFGAVVQPPAVANETGPACMVESFSGNFVIGWDGNRWLPLGAGLSAPLALDDLHADNLTIFDPDGAGPIPESLCVHGSFNTAGTVAIPLDTATCLPNNANARWTAASWSRAGLDHDYESRTAPRGFSILATAEFDPDGPGPVPSAIHIAGSFDRIESQPVNGPLARWNHALNAGAGGWQNFGSITGGSSVHALLTCDPDGPGPAPIRLYAAGDFDSVYLDPVSAFGAVVAWDGGAWTTTGFAAGTSVVTRMLTFDPDETGPLPARLIAGGDFVLPTPLGTARDIAQYDGAQWAPLGPGSFTGSADGSATRITALAIFDDDAEGPTPPALYVAGNFLQRTGGLIMRGIARWNGAEWSPVLPDLLPPADLCAVITQPLPLDLVAFDPHGQPAAMPRSLFVAGAFTVPGTASQAIARWDGNVWHALGAGLSFSPYSRPCGPPTARALKVFDDDGAGPDPPALFVAGNFLTAGGVPARALAKWGCQQSASPPPCPGDGNGDRVVNFSDITAVLTNWLNAGPAGDANHDGAVSFADITAVLAYFSIPCP